MTLATEGPKDYTNVQESHVTVSIATEKRRPKGWVNVKIEQPPSPDGVAWYSHTAVLSPEEREAALQIEPFFSVSKPQMNSVSNSQASRTSEKPEHKETLSNCSSASTSCFLSPPQLEAQARFDASFSRQMELALNDGEVNQDFLHPEKKINQLDEEKPQSSIFPFFSTIKEPSNTSGQHDGLLKCGVASKIMKNCGPQHTELPTYEENLMGPSHEDLVGKDIVVRCKAIKDGEQSSTGSCSTTLESGVSSPTIKEDETTENGGLSPATFKLSNEKRDEDIISLANTSVSSITEMSDIMSSHGYVVPGRADLPRQSGRGLASIGDVAVWLSDKLLPCDCSCNNTQNREVVEGETYKAEQYMLG